MLSDEVVIFESVDIRHRCQHILIAYLLSYCFSIIGTWILIIIHVYNFTYRYTEQRIFYFLCEKKLHWKVLSEKKIYNDKVYNIICNKNELFYNFSHCLILALNLTCTTLSIYKLNFFCTRLVSLLLILLIWCGVFQIIFGRRVWSVQGNCKAL